MCLSLCYLYCLLQCGVPEVQPWLSLSSPLLPLQLSPLSCLPSCVTLYLGLLHVKQSSRSWMPLCRHVKCHSWLKPETWAILDSLSHLLFRIQPLFSTLSTCALSPSPLSLT